MPPVPAPRRVPNRVGSLVNTAASIGQIDRIDAYTFTPELCGTGGTARVCGDAEGTGDTKDLSDLPDIVSFDAYWIHQGTSCNRASGPDTFTDTLGRASRALDTNTSHLIENALWTGDVDGNATNHPLADTDAFQPNGRTAVGLVTGIWDIVEYFNDTIGGARGFIHVEQRVVPFLSFYGLVERVGNLLQLRNTDHLVVAGTGYPGTDPDGAEPAAGESWIYGTTPVEYGLGQIFALPETEAETLNRQTNQIEVRAERLAVAYWDECAHVGTAVCLEDPGPDCEAGS